MSTWGVNPVVTGHLLCIILDGTVRQMKEKLNSQMTNAYVNSSEDSITVCYRVLSILSHFAIALTEPRSNGAHFPSHSSVP